MPTRLLPLQGSFNSESAAPLPMRSLTLPLVFLLIAGTTRLPRATAPRALLCAATPRSVRDPVTFAAGTRDASPRMVFLSRYFALCLLCALRTPFGLVLRRKRS